MTKMSTPRHTETGDPHIVEWLTGLFSAACVMAMIAWMGVQAIGQRDDAPDLSVSIVRQEARSGGYQVGFEIRNAASATAAQVLVRGELFDGDAAVEVVETTLDYVPMQSQASGGLIFRHDPAGKAIRIGAVGYADP